MFILYMYIYIYIHIWATPFGVTPKVFTWPARSWTALALTYVRCLSRLSVSVVRLRRSWPVVPNLHLLRIFRLPDRRENPRLKPQRSHSVPVGIIANHYGLGYDAESPSSSTSNAILFVSATAVDPVAEVACLPVSVNGLMLWLCANVLSCAAITLNAVGGRWARPGRCRWCFYVPRVCCAATVSQLLP